MPLKTYRLDRTPLAGSIGIYGAVGVGKTTLLKSMPGNGLLIDVPVLEGGDLVLGDADTADRVEAYTCTEWNQVQEVFEELRKGTALQSGKKLNWVAFDSVTGLLKLAYNKIVNDRDKRLDQAPHKITLPEHGQAGALVNKLILDCNNLPQMGQNIWRIWIAQQRKHGGKNEDDDDGESEPLRMGPDVIRSVLTTLTPPLMLLGRLTVTVNDDTGEQTRVMRVGPPDHFYMAKYRAKPGKTLPNLIKDPDLGGILKYLLADGKRPRAAKEIDSAADLIN